uniref:U3 small nucleolar RNA-associated protein 6 n=1 Tax=Lygus hesperus TaxID=30085 RepID=A0A0K8SC87_LYGHE
MAEYVQINLEYMLPELETMEKIELFNKDEVRRIIKKRKEYEYKLQRGAKFKEDLLNYIRYEWDLLVVIKNKTLADKSYAPKRNNVAHSVSQHIQKLFTDALRRFGSDVKVWLSYIDFCVQLHLFPAMSQSLEKMLQLHPDKPQLFVTAAQTEYNILGSMDRARMFFLNGIRFHKESELLYRESFSMELAHVRNLRKKNKKEEISDDDPVMNGRLAELIYESSLMNIRSIELISDLYAISKKYPFVNKLSDRIFNDIQEKFKDKELRWDIVARYKLENPPEDSTAKDAVRECIAVYQEAVKVLNTFEMWSYYVETMLELNEDHTYLKNFKTNCLMEAFLEAHSAEKLKEEYYLKWASRLDGDNDKEKRRDVLKSGAGKCPSSVQLWEEYFKCLTLMDTPWDVLMKSFNSAVSQIKSSKSCPLPLWKFMINYAQLTDPAKAEDLMKRGVKAGGNVSLAIKTMYLEWLVITRGLKSEEKCIRKTWRFRLFQYNFTRR